MKNRIILLIIFVAIILIALIFDWGRGSKEIYNIDLNASTTEIFHQISSSTVDMPIIVENIKDNQGISSPVTIKGKARGGWFFEATFPVELVDTNGNIIVSTTAQALGDWATTSFVDFIATFEYTKSTSTDRALLILSKDNPSDNPDFEQSIFIPVVLK